VAATDTNPTTEGGGATTDVVAVTASNPTTAVGDAMTAATTAGLAIGTVPSATTLILHSVRNATGVVSHAETLHRSLETVASTEGTTDAVASIEETTTVVAATIAVTTAEAVAVTIHATEETGIVQSAAT
jgi:hypothetical protein